MRTSKLTDVRKLRSRAFSCAARAGCAHAVELAGLLVEGGSLLDGAEAGDAEGLTGLGDGLGPAADVLVVAAALGVGLLGDEFAVLVGHQAGSVESSTGLLATSIPHLAAGSTDANATGHFELLSLCERTGEDHTIDDIIYHHLLYTQSQCSDRSYVNTLKSAGRVRAAGKGI